jgi:hypothetical protein
MGFHSGLLMPAAIALKMKAPEVFRGFFFGNG